MCNLSHNVHGACLFAVCEVELRIPEMHNAGIRPKTNAGVALTGQRLGRWVVGGDQSDPAMLPSEPTTVL